MANPSVVVDFVANTRDLQKGFDQASGKASGFGSKLAGLAKAGAVAGLAALTAGLKVGVEEFGEAQKVAAQTNAVLKSTGGAANVSAKQISSLAGALMKKSGVDDELIQSGENVLLTFTNIRNEAGKGNDVFNQTTKAALDMSVALGTDMKSASMTLGKALNDPVKGMAKLTKQGVTFTDAQKKQAAAMAESGNVAGAQKIILAELSKEFGGSAEAAGKTLPGQLNILKQSFSNLAGELVGKMIPPLTAAAKFMVENKTAVLVLTGVLAGLGAGVLAVNAAMAIYRATQTVIAAATKAWTVAQGALNVVMALNPIMLVVVAVAALVAAFIIAYKTSDTFRGIVDGAFKAIKSAAVAVFNWIKSNWPLLLAIITGPIGLALAAVIRNWDRIKEVTRDMINAVKTVLANGWDAVKTTASNVWGAVLAKIRDVIGDVKSVLTGLASWLTGFASGAFHAAVGRVKDIWDNITDGARAMRDRAKDAVRDLADFLEGIVGRMRGVASSIANAIKAPINAVIRTWNSLQIPHVGFTIPSFKVGPKKFGGGSVGFGPFPFPDIPQLAKGGVVDQPTLAMVGERGREIVTPERLLRDMLSEQQVQVRVYIGDQELRGLVRTEIVSSDTGIARTLLAG